MSQIRRITNRMRTIRVRIPAIRRQRRPWLSSSVLNRNPSSLTRFSYHVRTVSLLFISPRFLSRSRCWKSGKSTIFKQEIGEKLSSIGSRLDYPKLTKELALEIDMLWRDLAIQETYARSSIIQVPNCAHYFIKTFRDLLM